MNIDPAKYGITFSLKQCRNFGLDPRETLAWLLQQGWRRFRLMSYWDEHEALQGQYNFSELSWQISAIAKTGGQVSLCLGVKQPRWPEYHWPKWALALEKPQRSAALLAYVERVVSTYKNEDCLVSWQLENEALLQGFGENIDIDRTRLCQEYDLVKQLDPSRPVSMSTSNGWGVAIRAPQADVVGFSYYPVMYKNGAYHSGIQRPWLHRMRKHVIQGLLRKPVFVHELQCEPWGPTATWKMSTAEQDKSMSPQQITKNIAAARRIKAYPIDLWGSEWWYWRHKNGATDIYRAVTSSTGSERT